MFNLNWQRSKQIPLFIYSTMTQTMSEGFIAVNMAM